jgi:hypothetical protein
LLGWLSTVLQHYALLGLLTVLPNVIPHSFARPAAEFTFV